jgi:hypothetical protein
VRRGDLDTFSKGRRRVKLQFTLHFVELDEQVRKILLNREPTRLPVVDPSPIQGRVDQRGCGRSTMARVNSQGGLTTANSSAGS